MMNMSFILRTEAWIIALSLFVLMVISTWVGRIVGKRIREQGHQKDKLTETSGLTGLLFFLLAFTFSMSASRYDARRTTVIEEANDIGTAILRSDLYPDSVRNLF